MLCEVEVIVIYLDEIKLMTNFAVPLDREQIRRFLEEDLGNGDLTAQLLPEHRQATARVVTREPAVVCGAPFFDAIFAELDPRVVVEWQVQEGDEVDGGAELCRLQGAARALFTGERTALNVLQTLAATATTTRQYVRAVAGTGAQILDTRKTLPGLRQAQKYAVRVGGGVNHRCGLYDAILIKENHIAAAGSIGLAVAAAATLAGDVLIEIEVESLEQLEEALSAGVRRVLLDNFAIDRLRQAVILNAGRAALEASGGICLDNVRAVAQTGVDFISIGALTKHVHAVDLSMRVVCVI